MFLNLKRFLVETNKYWDWIGFKLSFLAEVEDNDEKEKANLGFEKDLMNSLKNKDKSQSGSDYLDIFGSLKCLIPFSKCKKQKKPGKPKENRLFGALDYVPTDWDNYDLSGLDVWKQAYQINRFL